MARTDNLTNFCEDIADSIRSVTGKTDKIPASQFDTEIKAIDTEPNLQDKEMTIYENQQLNITADEGYDGLGEVNVNLKVGTEIAWVVKEGIEQEDFTGGSTYTLYAATEPGSKTQGDGYIALCAKVWSHYLWKFNNKIDLKKYTRAYIDCAYPKTSSPYANQYAGLQIGLLESNFNRDLKSGSTMKRRTIEITLDSHLDEDTLYFGVINTGDYSSYKSYPMQIFNVWLEGEPETAEDLTEELSTQNSEISEQEISIEDIQNALLGKMAGGSSSGISNLNIFIQEGEPVSKDGIWFKTDKELSYNKVIQKNITKPFRWIIDINDEKNLPYVRDVGIASVGTKLYLFGGITMYNVYRGGVIYDTINRTYSSMATMPYNARGIMAIDYGTDIYIFGGASSGTVYSKIHKYDTLTNSFTALGDLPVGLCMGGIARVGTNIYILGGALGNSNSNAIYKFDILTNTCTKDALLEQGAGSMAVCSLNTDIYIFGGWTTAALSKCYKYDTVNKTLTNIADYPITIATAAANTYRDKILIMGGDTAGGDKMTDKTYLYDPKTDTYTEQAKLWTNAGLGRFCGSAKVNQNIYLPGGSWDPSIGGGGGELATITKCVVDEEIYSYSGNDKCLMLPISSLFNNNEVTIQNNDNLTFKILMLDCLHYTKEDGFDTTVETYYGNGSEWIKIIR